MARRRRVSTASPTSERRRQRRFRFRCCANAPSCAALNGGSMRSSASRGPTSFTRTRRCSSGCRPFAPRVTTACHSSTRFATCGRTPPSTAASSAPTRRSTSWRRRVETDVLRGADAVVTICEALRRELEPRVPNKSRVSVVENGVDVAAVLPGLASHGTALIPQPPAASWPTSVPFSRTKGWTFW